jgi:hypothetical protein
MARYLVFPTEGAALDAEAKVSARARVIYRAQGYGVDAQGAIIGKDALTGELEPDAQRTVRYAVPRQRLDGQWVIPHPEGQAAADFVINAQGVTVKEYVMQDLAGAVIEAFSAAWFPAPAFP